MLPDQERRAWWYAAWRWADGDRSKFAVLRDLPRWMADRPLWPLVCSELGALATSGDGTDSGRLAFAVLLDVARRLAPASYSALLDGLATPVGQVDLEAIGRLWGGFEPVTRAYAQKLRVALGGVAMTDLQLVTRAGLDVLPAEIDPVGDAAMTRRQGEALLRYRSGSADLLTTRAGVAAAAVWARDDARRAKLARIEGFEPRPTFIDLVTLLALAALRMRRELSGRGLGWIPPDVTVIDTPITALAAEVGRATVSTVGVDARSSPRDRPAVVDMPRVVVPVPAQETPAAVAASQAPPASVDRREAWLEGAREWAAGDRRKLKALVDDTVSRLQASLLWSTLDREVRRLPLAGTQRVQEIGRIALATFLDEFRRAYPQRYHSILDLVTVETNEVIRHDEIGRLWKELEPLFKGWAQGLAPDVDLQDSVKVVQVLHAHGDILPYDDAKKARKLRDKGADHVIDQVYGEGAREPELVRRAVYWAVTRARNDFAHSNTSGLLGRVAPLHLLRDCIALASIASIRFRLRQAENDRISATVPDVLCLDRSAG